MLRNGGYVPFFQVERKTSEQALIQVIQKAFINEVSTRKVERLAKALGIEGMSASQVSEITNGLDEQVEAFRTRTLEEAAFVNVVVASSFSLWSPDCRLDGFLGGVGTPPLLRKSILEPSTTKAFPNSVTLRPFALLLLSV